MLSNIGRAAIKRVGASSQSTNKALGSFWYINRVSSTNSEICTAQLQSSFSLHPRSYATAVKATKTVTKAAPKAKTTTTKAKPKPKVKKAAKKSPKKKPIKKKPVKKKAVAKKRVVKPKKVLTETEKLKAEVKVLKVTALLKAPKLAPATAWTVLFSDVVKSGSGTGSALATTAAAKYKELSAAELEALNHTANQNKVANENALKKWIESHTVDEIRLANNARTQLNRKRKELGYKSTYRKIADDRKPKQAAPARFHFVRERFSSGDFKGVRVAEASKLISAEWDALPASEKKVFEDQATADKQRYLAEFKTVYKRDSISPVAA